MLNHLARTDGLRGATLALRHGAPILQLGIAVDGRTELFSAVIYQFVPWALPGQSTDVTPITLLVGWQRENADRVLVLSLGNGRQTFDVPADIDTTVPGYFAGAGPTARNIARLVDGNDHFAASARGSGTLALDHAGGDCDVLEGATPRENEKVNVTCQRATFQISFDATLYRWHLGYPGVQGERMDNVRLRMPSRRLEGLRFVWKGCPPPEPGSTFWSCYTVFPGGVANGAPLP